MFHAVDYSGIVASYVRIINGTKQCIILHFPKPVTNERFETLHVSVVKMAGLYFQRVLHHLRNSRNLI